MFKLVAMRCKNCGWENPEGSLRCSKCNAPLVGSMVERGVSPEDNKPLSGTVREDVEVEAVVSEKNCPRCGYPIRPDSDLCPSCGCPLDAAPVQQPVEQPVSAGPVGGTVNSWMNPEKGVFCTLKPIAWVNEKIDYQPVSYSGDKIILKRSNTDANNNSISSKAQAQLTNDGKDWYIENKSDQETTFIKVSRKTKLEPGDIIVLGNRLFEFQG